MKPTTPHTPKELLAAFERAGYVPTNRSERRAVQAYLRTVKNNCRAVIAFSDYRLRENGIRADIGMSLRSSREFAIAVLRLAILARFQANRAELAEQYQEFVGSVLLLMAQYGYSDLAEQAARSL